MKNRRWARGSHLENSSQKDRKEKKLVKDGEACFVFINFSVTYLSQQMYDMHNVQNKTDYHCSLISCISHFLPRTSI